MGTLVQTKLWVLMRSYTEFTNQKDSYTHTDTHIPVHVILLANTGTCTTAQSRLSPLFGVGLISTSPTLIRGYILD